MNSKQCKISTSTDVCINSSLSKTNVVDISSRVCAECTRQISSDQLFSSCNMCSLDYHNVCVNVSSTTANTWWCNSCFFKASISELPFDEGYVDYKCFSGKGLKIAHLNIRSIKNKIDHLRVFLYQNSVDILCLSETWLNSDINDSEILIEGYDFCRIDRKLMEHDRGGGLICYIKNCIVYKEVSNFNADNVESLWVEVKLPHSKPFLVGTVYRPPDANADYLSTLDSMFQHYTALYDDVIILGDFNLDLCKRLNCTKINNISKHSNLTQLIKDCTRITDTSSTLLDLIFVTNLEKCFSSGVHALGLSDHSLIYLVRKSKKVHTEPRTITSRSFTKFNDKNFVDSVRTVDWDKVTSCSDVNSALTIWNQLFNNVCNRHAPVKKRRVNGSLPEWINKDYVQLSKDRDYFFSKAHKTNDPQDWVIAKSLRNKVNNLGRSLKRTYCTNAISNNINNSHKLWSTIKKLLPTNKVSVKSVYNHSTDDYTTCDKDTANQFNNYFTSIGNSLANKFNNTGRNIDKSNSVDSTFQFDIITDDYIFDKICQLSNNKSPGLDGFQVKLLKLAAPIICKPLAYICNLSLATSTFPHEWKQAKVTPIFKDGDRSDVSNYRPISVLSTVSKIIERAVHDQLYSYLTENNILHPSQSGFRSGHSTNTALLDVSDFILNNMNSGKATAALFLDLKKAFDTVDHDILISKLDDFGVKGSALNWFKSYLTDRSQIVSVNSNFSDPQGINIGVPQGSILGPLLFIIYINSLPINVTCKCVMYADDTTLLCSSTDPEELKSDLSLNLNRIGKWFQVNKLTLNVKKTKLMVFGSPHILKTFDNISLTYNSDVIDRVDSYKYLGVMFDPCLTWCNHINKISSSVSKRIGLIRRIKFFLPNSTLRMLANALIMPHFDYCSSVWSNCNARSSDSLQILHNRLARVLLSADIRTSVNKMMGDLDWVKLSQRWDYQLLVQIFKCLKQIAPMYISKHFVFTSSLHSKCTRSQTQNTLVVPAWNTISGKRTFHYRAAVAWNKLPPTIRTNFDQLSIDQFKSAIA